MRELLSDFLTNISGVDINKIRIKSMNDGVLFEATDKQKFALKAFSSTTLEDKGTFGMDNIPMLRGIMNFFHSDKDRINEIQTTFHKNRENKLVEIEFNLKGLSQVKYRLLSDKARDLEQPEYPEVTTDLSITNINKGQVTKFNELSNILSSNEKHFTISCKNGTVEFKIGEDGGSTVAKMVFSNTGKGSLNESVPFDLSTFVSIIRHGANAGNMEIDVIKEGFLFIRYSTPVMAYDYMLFGKTSL